MEELKCKVCGKLASDDTHFYKSKQLCNRHALQLRNHGKFLDHDLIINQSRNFWIEDEKIKLEQLISQGSTIAQAATILKKSISSVADMNSKLGLGDKYKKKNSINYKAVYQNYDWCYERYVNKGMSHQDMADEIGVTKRVIQKWCVEKFHLDETFFKENKHLSNIQKELIIAGTLGDGHIDKRPDQPMYIESHAIDEKDYIFWKYSILKDICHQQPVYYAESYATFGTEKSYLCKPYYRINLRIIYDLKSIREMKNIDKIKNISEFQFSLLLLDDGSRSNLWQLCVANWTTEEINALIEKCEKQFKIRTSKCQDTRYIHFDAESSIKLDNMILKYMPNDLDIIKKKITNNNKIRPYKNSFYIICEDKKIGLARYCKENHIIYKNAKKEVEKLTLDFHELLEKDFLYIMQGCKDI